MIERNRARDLEQNKATFLFGVDHMYRPAWGIRVAIDYAIIEYRIRFENIVLDFIFTVSVCFLLNVFLDKYFSINPWVREHREQWNYTSGATIYIYKN